jgi:hypothetical protein
MCKLTAPDSEEYDEEDSKLAIEQNISKLMSTRIVIVGERPSEPTTFVRCSSAVKIYPSVVEIYLIKEKLNSKDLQKVDSIHMV